MQQKTGPPCAPYITSHFDSVHPISDSKAAIV
jgi:hypothetical protein